MKITQYNLITIDGYITDKEGKEGIFPQDLFEQYLILCERFGCVIMGGTTYNTLQSWNIKDKRFLKTQKIIISAKEIVTSDDIQRVSSPDDAINKAREFGFENVLLCSGQTINTLFLKKNLIDEIILCIYSVVVGQGCSLYKENILTNFSIKKVEMINLKSVMIFYEKNK